MKYSTWCFERCDLGEVVHFLTAVIILTLVFIPAISNAESSGVSVSPMTLTITPPYFSVGLAPGSSWSSVVKFSNGSERPLRVNIRAHNFRTDGASGITFDPPSGEVTTQAYELASWVTVPSAVQTIRSGETLVVPFTINVPDNAEPGGHYAGIVIGSELETESDAIVGVTSALSSLLLVRVSGETNEAGFIRDFSAERLLSDRQEASFILEFKNTGNVHIAPEGVVSITNMFGRERGRVYIDSTNSMGHILPFSTKKLKLEWKGEDNFFDIGPYKALATLHYGESGEKVAYHRSYFFVFPIIPVLVMTIFLYLFVRVLKISARRYIKRALLLEASERKEGNHHKAHGLSLKILEQPLRMGALDLVGYSVGGKRHHAMSTHAFFKKYKLFFTYLALIVIGFVCIGYYLAQVFKAEREFQISVTRGDQKSQIIPQKSIR